MRRETNRKWVLPFAAASFAVALQALSFSPVYEVENADVRPDAVMCRLTGTETVAADAFGRQAFWSDKNYEGQLGIAHVEGKGLCLTGSSKICDTAWHALSERIALKGGCARYRLAFSVDPTVTINDMGKDGETWSSLTSIYPPLSRTGAVSSFEMTSGETTSAPRTDAYRKINAPQRIAHRFPILLACLQFNV